MHTTHLRHLLHIHRSKIAGLLLLCGFVTHGVQAQSTRYVRRHLEFYDDKPIHYGFLLALPVTRYTLQHSDTFLDSDSAYSIVSPAKGAFRVGFTINALLNDQFDLRTTPSVSLYERQVKYSYPNGGERLENRESTWVELPLLLKYKSTRRVNTRMYLIGGITLAVETNVKRSRGNAVGNQLDTRTSDVTLDYGIGFEQFFQYFKFAPELRFSHGLVNSLQSGNNPAATGLNRLTTHTVTLCLNFE